jgi:hypothetical protein
LNLALKVLSGLDFFFHGTKKVKFCWPVLLSTAQDKIPAESVALVRCEGLRISDRVQMSYWWEHQASTHWPKSRACSLIPATEDIWPCLAECTNINWNVHEEVQWMFGSI